MMKYTVLIECDEETLSDGGDLAHIPAVPGCVGRGPTQEAAAARCRETLQSYLARLLNAGALGAPDDEKPVELEVVETMSHTFDSDYSILQPNDAEQLVQWLEVSRDELLELVTRLPPDALDWKPTAGSWPIRHILGHVAYCDWLYVQHLADAPLDWPEELFGRLAAARDLLIVRLGALSDEQRAHVTTAHGEDWTPRKVVRRALEHEREHLQHIGELVQQYGNASESKL